MVRVSFLLVDPLCLFFVFPRRQLRTLMLAKDLMAKALMAKALKKLLIARIPR